jgi:S-adenosylmethionine synthetase
MLNLVLSPLETANDIEIVERKGTGHPDSICDALAETLSRNLCLEYKHRFDEILHHNVDKALLCAGCAEPAFGGGRVTVPIKILLAGRAVGKIRNEVIPIEEIAVEGSRAWLKQNLHALDADREVSIDAFIQHGSQDLQTLFSRKEASGVPLANDTSFGVGYAPLSAIERLTLAIDQRLYSLSQNHRPAWGEDVKIMSIRSNNKLQITVACAMVGRWLVGLNDYVEQKALLTEEIRGLAIEHGFCHCDVIVNAADDDATGSVYLTVTGTSAESGDDGQVGRGNRVNGLITPCRPMSLEAAAGKNPCSHVGKIYNVIAKEIAEDLVSRHAEVEAVECLMVSKIGAPISSPALVQIRLATKDGVPPVDMRRPVEAVVAARLQSTSKLMDSFLTGSIKIF